MLAVSENISHLRFTLNKFKNQKFSISGNASSSANTSQSQQAFIFHVQNQQPLTHKAAVYYHQQLALQEDQGLCVLRTQ